MLLTKPAALRSSIRREILRQRDALPAALRHNKSTFIHERVLADPTINKARTIFTYINFRSEVETMTLIALWIASGKTVCVPLTLVDDSRLVAYQITDLANDLTPGYCQIPEPDPSSATMINPSDIDVIILPGSAFDLYGGRLGYGGGFYDRFITNQAPHATRIGLAFELQVIDNLPLLPHDQPLNALITEARTLQFK